MDNNTGSAGKSRIPLSPQTVLLAAIFLVCLLGSILTCASSFVLGIILSALLTALSLVITVSRERRGIVQKKSAVVSDIIVILLLTAFFFSMPPLMMSSSALWQYPIQKRFADMYHNEREPEFFPEFKSAVKSDYCFDYLPSILQGTGHYSVRFITDDEHIKQYEDMFAPQAVHIYKDQDGGSFFSAEEILSGGEKGTVNIYNDREFFDGCTVTIYVLYTNYNFNHPHSSAVIIDRATGRVQFSQYG